MFAQLNGANYDIWANQIIVLLSSKGLWMYLEKPLLPNVQDMTPSISHFITFGSSTCAHIPIYCLYDPSTHKVIDVQDVIFYEVPIHSPPVSFHCFLQIVHPEMILSIFQTSVDLSLYDVSPFWMPYI
jgi:hypothetical protein